MRMSLWKIVLIGCLVIGLAWIWWEILPVPLFRVPYSTVLLDKEDEIIGLKTAEDVQLRLQSEGS